MKKETILIVWLICDLIWSVFVIGGTAYLVFYRGISDWWFLLAIFIVPQSLLYEELKRYFTNQTIKKEKEGK